MAEDTSTHHTFTQHEKNRILRSFIDAIECQCRKVYAPAPTIDMCIGGLSNGRHMIDGVPGSIQCLALRLHCPIVKSLIDDPDLGGREDLSGYYHCLVSLPEYKVLVAESQSPGLDDTLVRQECWVTFLKKYLEE